MNKILLLLAMTLCLGACHKDFLDQTPDKALLVPSTLADFRMLLNNDQMKFVPALSLVGSDDFALETPLLNSMPVHVRNAYTWNKDIFEGTTSSDWNVPNNMIFLSNIILDGLKGIDPSVNKSEYDQIKGEALFNRSIALYHLSQLFCEPYLSPTADNLKGLPLRLEADVNKVVKRSSLYQTYLQIQQDLKLSAELLPIKVPFKNRPNKAAALALLARTYLVMGDYSQGYFYANECLKINGQLIDYNTLTLTASRPLPSALPFGNEEVIYYAPLLQLSLLTSTLANINPQLYQSYASNDLRKQAFFLGRANNVFTFKGTYGGSASSLAFFAGLATDEIYLIKAECAVRLNRISEGMEELNKLLIKRWKTGTYVPHVANQKVDALRLIFAERRKELVCRGTRWSDLRRMNLENDLAITLNRTIVPSYSLAPNDPKYVLPIPDDEVTLGGLEQNIR